MYWPWKRQEEDFDSPDRINKFDVPKIPSPKAPRLAIYHQTKKDRYCSRVRVYDNEGHFSHNKSLGFYPTYEEAEAAALKFVSQTGFEYAAKHPDEWKRLSDESLKRIMEARAWSSSDKKW